jgi:methanogenic corrinoid protein MtbC1
MESRVAGKEAVRMLTAAAHPECATLLGYLLTADERAAVRLAHRLLDAGTSPEDVLLRLVAPVQANIGELWARNRLSVADEHVASCINERVTAACAGIGRPPRRRGRLVIACADGESHTLPARLLGDTLRLRGWHVTFLGAGLPAAHLTTYLRQREPAAVLLSISLSVRLPSAHRSVLAARRAGVPVLAGGRGFGDTADWAYRLGAAGWAADAVEAAAVLDDWPPAPVDHAGLGHPDDDEYARLAAETPRLVEGALAVLAEQVRGYTDRQREATVEDLHHIAAFLAAAVFVDDEAVFADFVWWLADVLVARQVPIAGVDLVLRHLGDTLAGRARTTRMLAAGRTVLATRR